MDKTLLEILACPVCKSSVLYQKQSQELVCKACRVAYPIRDEIPVVLIDEARELTAEETY